MQLDLELLAEIQADLPTIDLHFSNSPQDALTELDQELTQFTKKKITACRVVYGIGMGVMRRAVLQELSNHPLVRGVAEESSGGSAVVGL